MAEVVIAAKPAEGEVERKMMVAIDETDHSHYALIWILDNLKESIAKFPLTIFMAQPTIKSNFTFEAPFGYARLYSSALTTQDFVNSAQDKQRKLTLALLEKAKDICASRGGKFLEMVTEIGDPKVAICSAAEKLNINLLILGEAQGGIGKIKRLVLPLGFNRERKQLLHSECAMPCSGCEEMIRNKSKPQDQIRTDLQCYAGCNLL